MRPSAAVTPTGRPGARRDVNDGIDPMKSVITARSGLSTELGDLLARAYRRLTEKRGSSAASGADSGRENPLDVPRRESPHVVKVEQR